MSVPLVSYARLQAVEVERDAARSEVAALTAACASLTETVKAQQETMQTLAGQVLALRAANAQLQVTMLTLPYWAASPTQTREADHGTPSPR